MSDWAQWLVNKNLKLIVYILYVSAFPLAVAWYIVLETFPEIMGMARKDWQTIKSAKRAK